MPIAAKWLEHALESHRTRPAVADGRDVIEAGMLLGDARDLAGTMGSAEGRRVAVLGEQGIGWVRNLMSVWLAGGVAVPVSPRLDAQRKELLVSTCSATLERDHLSGPRAVAAREDPDDAAVVLLTSGSTGPGREVILTHGNLETHAIAAAERLALRPGDHWLTSLPVSHTGGLGVVLRSLHAGSLAGIRPAFDLREWGELMMDAETPVTLVSLVPTMLRRLLGSGIGPAPGLRAAIVGGAPLDRRLREEALAAGWPLLETWGMTETAGMATLADPSTRLGTGPALEGVAIRIGDEDEVIVSGPAVSPSVGGPGEFRTGDLGHFEDGSLVITGRRGSMLISGGENVAPERVESVLMEIAGIGECLVRGERDPEWGEVVVAELVAEPALSDTEILEHCRKRLSPWEVPKRLSRVDSLERTESGKIRRSRRDA